MRICVVALGKVGLPLAVQAATAGHAVVGADINPAVVDQVNGATPPFPGEHQLAERLGDAIEAGRLRATTDVTAAAADAEAVAVVVPLMVDDRAEPDFTAMDIATRAVGEGLQPGTLVSYETTMPVGTTRDRFAPVLADTSGLTLGRELFVAHSPERVLSGRVFADLRRYPKLVGGVDEASAKRAVAFYEAVLTFDERPNLDRPNGVWNLGSVEAAELAKLMETTYRDVNIALANEFARYADRAGIDVHAAIEAANSQPYSHIHRPGIAVGGHCIPVYPHFYLAGDPDARLPAAARQVNDDMPRYAVERLAEELGGLHDAVVAVLGAAYRGGVKETAFSGVFALVDALRSYGAQARVHDPLFDDAELEALGFEPYRLGEPCDAAMLQADHREYREMTEAELPGAALIIDGRGVLDSHRWSRHLRLGGGTDSQLSLRRYRN